MPYFVIKHVTQPVFRLGSATPVFDSGQGLFAVTHTVRGENFALLGRYGAALKERAQDSADARGAFLVESPNLNADKHDIERLIEEHLDQAMADDVAPSPGPAL